MTKKETPVRRQYLDIKKQYPDAILFFRLGDFYETFDEDAKIAARELDIVLTSRDVAKGQPVPMAGIPHHAAENYLARLIEKGYHVAICEQMGESPVKGLFPREVVRVVTPGTVVEPGLLPNEANNYLLSVSLGPDRAGLAYVDVSTGEFAATEIQTRQLRSAVLQEIERLDPVEILAARGFEPDEGITGHLTELPEWKYELERCQDRLKEHFGVATLEGYGLSGKPQAVQAAGAILQYLGDTQRAVVGLLKDLSVYSLDEFMVLDVATRRNLELTRTIRGGRVEGSLLGVIDETVTPMGKRLLQQWLSKPLLEVSRIQRRHDQVEAFFKAGVWRAEVRQALSELGDLERLTNRAVAGVAIPRDLEAMRDLLSRIPPIMEILHSGDHHLGDLLSEIDSCDQVQSLLGEALRDDPPATLNQIGVIRAGYDQTLDEVVRSSESARSWIADLEGVERKRTGIRSLKVGFNKVFGYYIEVTKANTDQVPEDYIRKQTLVNAERYITPEMKEVEAKVLSAEDRIRELEAEIFSDLCSKIAVYAPRLLGLSRALARLDVVSALAEVAANRGFVKPVITEGEDLDIRDGRHPVVEDFLERGRRFVPNNTIFEKGERIRVITGPNMSGKSTYLRQVALIMLLAQMGSFVPARQARLGLADRIFTRIGAQDEIHAGQSTFMVEMIEAANILHNATPKSLLILDEVGRGTSTYDGLSIAWAMVEYTHSHPNLRSRTLFATHYHELTELADHLPGVRNYNVEVAEEGDRVVFLYKIRSGRADKSYGIHVAEIAGLPRPVINRAQEILSRLERESPDSPLHQAPGGTQQLKLFPDGSALLEALSELDVETLSPLDALNLLYEWKHRYLGGDGGD